MGGLVLKLRAHEEVFVNGVRMRNGERNIRLLVRSPDASILRMSEAISEEEAVTPVTRLCFHAQQMVAGLLPVEAGVPSLQRGIGELRQSPVGLKAEADLDTALEAIDEGKYYLAFRALKRVVQIERELAEGAPPVEQSCAAGEMVAKPS